MHLPSSPSFCSADLSWGSSDLGGRHETSAFQMNWTSIQSSLWRCPVWSMTAFSPEPSQAKILAPFTKSGGAAAALSVPLRRRVSEPSDLSQTALGFLRRQCLAKTETNWCCPGRSAVNDSLSLVLMNLCSARSGVQDKDPYDRAH